MTEFSVQNSANSVVVSKYDYTNDELGQRTVMGKSGTAFTQTDTITYGYNTKSEVTSAVATNQTTYNYGFLFDPIGNRLSSASHETGSLVTRSYTSNQLNQYTAIDNPTASPTYDDDGNMLNDGTWAFTWNAENRIITAVQGTISVEYKYDYFGRRVERKVTENGTVTADVRYVYEQGSFNKLEELNALDSNAIVKKYIWGLDIAGSQTKTGSVGALLAQIDGVGTAYSTFDANGNASEYLDAAGVIQGHLEYSPFGKVTVENGVRPDDFNFRFSTKYEDALTGDLDYGYRDYDSMLGRWRSRDPIEEKGDENLYSFVSNNPITNIDINGLNWCVQWNPLGEMTQTGSWVSNGTNPDPKWISRGFTTGVIRCIFLCEVKKRQRGYWTYCGGYFAGDPYTRETTSYTKTTSTTGSATYSYYGHVWTVHCPFPTDSCP